MISSHLVVLKQLAHEEKPPKSKEKYLKEKEDSKSICIPFVNALSTEFYDKRSAN